MKWKVELGEDGYQIVAPDGTESGVAEYWEPALLVYQGKLHMALIPDLEDEWDELGTKVWVLAEVPSETEEVELELEANEEEEEVPE